MNSSLTSIAPSVRGPYGAVGFLAARASVVGLFWHLSRFVGATCALLPLIAQEMWTPGRVTVLGQRAGSVMIVGFTSLVSSVRGPYRSARFLDAHASVIGLF